MPNLKPSYSSTLPSHLPEMRILVDESCLTTSFVPRLRKGSLIEMGTLLKSRNVEMVASRIEVLISTDADAPSLSNRRRDVRINHVATKMIESVV